MVKFERGVYRSRWDEIMVISVTKKSLRYTDGGPVRTAEINWTYNHRNPEHPIQYIKLPNGRRVYATGHE